MNQRRFDLLNKAFADDALALLKCLRERQELGVEAEKWDIARDAARRRREFAAKRFGAGHWRAREAAADADYVEKLIPLTPEQRKLLGELAAIDKQLSDLHYRSQQDYEAKLALARRRLDICRQTVGDDTLPTADSMRRLAKVLLNVYQSDLGGDRQQADKMLRSSFAAYRRLLGDGHPTTLDTLAEITQAGLKTGDYAQAAADHALALEYDERLAEASRWSRADDFSRDSRQAWQAKGDVHWSPKRLVLGGDGKISVAPRSGASLVVDLQLEFPPLPADAPRASTQLWLLMSPTGWIRVNLLRQREGDAVQGAIQLEDVVIYRANQRQLTPQIKPAVVVRKFPLPGDLPSGAWQVRVHYGRIEVLHSGRRLAVGYVDKEPRPLPFDMPEGAAESLVAGEIQKLYTMGGYEHVSHANAERCGGPPPYPQRVDIRQEQGQVTLHAVTIEGVTPAHQIWTSDNYYDKFYLIEPKFALAHLLENFTFTELDDMTIGLAKADTFRQNLAEQFGVASPYYARALELSALHQAVLVNWPSALALQELACDILSRRLGAEHPQTAASQVRLARLQQNLANFDEAEKLLAQAAETFRTVLGERTTDWIETRRALSQLYEEMGQLAESERLAKEIAAAVRRAYGVDHPEYLAALDSLASVYRRIGARAAAVETYEQALQIANKIEPNALASFGVRGAQVEVVIGRNLEARLKSAKPPADGVLLKTPDAARFAVKLAALAVENGDWKTARRYHLSLLPEAPYTDYSNAPYIKNLGTIPSHKNVYWTAPSFLDDLIDWASVCAALGDTELSDHLINTAGAATSGKVNAFNVRRLLRHALLNEVTDDLDGALRRYAMAARLSAAVYGKDHFNTLKLVEQLGGYAWRRDEIEAAGENYQYALDGVLKLADQVLPGLPESRSMVFLQRHGLPVDPYLSMLESQTREQPDPAPSVRHRVANQGPRHAGRRSAAAVVAQRGRQAVGPAARRHPARTGAARARARGGGFCGQEANAAGRTDAPKGVAGDAARRIQRRIPPTDRLRQSDGRRPGAAAAAGCGGRRFARALALARARVRGRPRLGVAAQISQAAASRREVGC